VKIDIAVIPTAGYGTRMLPATKAIPKEMLPIVDRPTIDYIVSEAIAAGVDNIVLVTGRNKGEIEDYFDHAYELQDQLEQSNKSELLTEMKRISTMVNLVSLRQKEMKGLGHAVLASRAVVGDRPFGVLLGDDLVQSEVPCIKQLADALDNPNQAAISIMEVPREDVSKYGIIDGEDLGNGRYRVRGLVEKPSPENAPTNLAVIGRYVLPPGIFDILENTKPGKGGEIQLTDALAELANGPGVLACRLDGKRYDTGNALGFVQASVCYGLEHPIIGATLKKWLNSIVEK
jgi:UTP--glucose-1-phosphate uridylyltransferase